MGFSHMREEILNGVSMIPGIVMSVLWMRHIAFPGKLAMIGYTITCTCSIIYHLAHAYYGSDHSKNWLRLDMMGQNVGLALGISQTVLGNTSPLILAPLAILPLVANLDVAVERRLCLVANGTNILLTCMFSLKIILKWLVGFGFFIMDKTFTMHGGGHLLWHMMCHISIHEFFKHVSIMHPNPNASF